MTPRRPPLAACIRTASRALRRGLLALLLGAGLAAAPVAATAADATATEIERQFRAGEPGLALQRLERALVQRPGDAGLRFLKAVLMAELGLDDQATALLERLTEDFPDLPEPYNNLAVLQATDGRLDRARSLLETALRLDPGYRTAHENLGDVFVRLAERAYAAAAAGDGRVEAGLQTKLRGVRELGLTGRTHRQTPSPAWQMPNPNQDPEPRR